MKLFKFLWQFVRKQSTLFFSMALLSLAWTFEMLFWPYFLGQIVDLLSHFDTERLLAWPELKQLFIIGALLWFISEGSFRVRDFIYARAFPKLEADIRMTLFDHVQRHSPKYFNEHFSGKLASKIGDMVLTSTSILRDIIMAFIPATLTSIASTIIFGMINPWFAVILAGWLVLHILLCILFTFKCARFSYLHGESRSTLSGKIVDSLTNNFIVNLFFRFRYEKEYISHYQKDELKTNRQAQTYSAKMFAYLSAILLVEVFFLAGIAISFWMKKIITTGEVVQLLYTIWNLIMVLWFVADKAPEFFQSLGIARQALTLKDDAQDIMDPLDARKLVVKQGEIIFENVTFGYREEKIFQKKNLQIKPGEKVGLVGYSGAGKSTFVNLILRFFPIEEGRILIDGQDISKSTLESLRQQIALIPQDPILFHRTLEENIGYGLETATEKEIINAAKLAHCDGFIQKTASGYKTLVGERGTKLSGGEKQRIAIARAMLLGAPILILDEATSALDSVTEQYIQESLDQLMKNRTTIVVAHRLSTLSKMDRILVFDKGKIIEEGSHFELLQKGGHYAHMWKMQAGGFLPDQPE